MAILADILNLWQSAWPAGVTMLLIGTTFALVLLIASTKLKVEVNATVKRIHEALPNVDCGACGYPGCEHYAEAVFKDPSLLGQCSPGGPETSEKIAKILNIQISGTGPAKKPIVHCRAHEEDKTYYSNCTGIKTCTASHALSNSQACKFGCLGYGDCVASCKFSAIEIIDGLAEVNYDACTGCGACAQACPRNLIEMVPFNQENILAVACSSKEAGKYNRSICKVGCIACNICAKQSDLFTITDNLARMDYEKYEPTEQTQTAHDKCPTGVIVHRGKNAPPPRLP